MLQAPRLRPCGRGNVPTADAAACTAAAIANVAGVAVAAPPTDVVIFEPLLSLLLLELLMSLTLPNSAIMEGADGAEGFSFVTPPVPAPASAAGALRVATKLTPVMSRSDSLFTSATLPPPRLDAPSLLAPSSVVDSPFSAMRGKFCWGVGGVGGTCCPVTLRVVSMVRWVVSTRMQSRGLLTLGPT